jgi:hypothetical protein
MNTNLGPQPSQPLAGGNTPLGLLPELLLALRTMISDAVHTQLYQGQPADSQPTASQTHPTPPRETVPIQNNQIRASNIGLFYPNYDSKEPIENVIYACSDMIIQDVNFFINRIRDIVADNPSRND